MNLVAIAGVMVSGGCGCIPAVSVPPGVVSTGIPPQAGITDGPQPVVALTFDDGPSRYTMQIAEELHRRGIPATFFVLGSEVQRYPDIVRRLNSMGFGIGVHTMSHRSLPGLSVATQRREIGDEMALLTPLVGREKLKCMRPPYGSRSRTTDAVAGEFGLGVALWSVDPRNWERPGADAIVARVLSQVGNRGVVLLHDGGGPRSGTVAAVPRIVDALLARGYKFIRYC